MGEHDALRIGRRTRRIGDRGVVVVANCASDPQKFVAMLRKPRTPQPLERPESRFAGLQRQMPEDDDAFDRRQLVADTPDFGQLLLGDEQRLDLGMPQPEEQIVRLFEFHRKRDAHRPGIKEPQLRYDPSVAAFGEDRHLIARPDAQRCESRSDFERLLARLGIGRRLKGAVPLLQQKGLGSVRGDGAFEQVDDRLLHR